MDRNPGLVMCFYPKRVVSWILGIQVYGIETQCKASYLALQKNVRIPLITKINMLLCF